MNWLEQVLAANICVCLTVPHPAAADRLNPATQKTVPVEITEAVACVRQFPWDGLNALRLKSRARVRFHRGRIPGWGEEGLSDDVLSLLIYSDDHRKGVLQFTIKLKNNVVNVVENGYVLERTAHKWHASEGNGGLETYRLLSEFVTSLERAPIYTIDLQSLPHPNCCFGYKCETLGIP